jgi:hypothetical protein
MIVGGATVCLVEYRHNSCETECYPDRLKMILKHLDSGAISADRAWGTSGHVAALNLIISEATNIIERTKVWQEEQEQQAEDTD